MLLAEQCLVLEQDMLQEDRLLLMNRLLLPGGNFGAVAVAVAVLVYRTKTSLNSLSHTSCSNCKPVCVHRIHVSMVPVYN